MELVISALAPLTVGHRYRGKLKGKDVTVKVLREVPVEEWNYPIIPPDHIYLVDYQYIQ